MATIQHVVQDWRLQGNGEQWKDKEGDAFKKPFVQFLLLEHLYLYLELARVQSSLCHPVDHRADFLPLKCINRNFFHKELGAGAH